MKSNEVQYYLQDNETELRNSLGYIVAIGASAGGLQALQEFFDHMNPDTNACFVIIQHLSPDYKSMMDEILGRHTSMPVSIAEHDDELLPNHIYVIPPGKNISISKNKLVLSDIHKEYGQNLPIDIFFRSTASSVGLRSIGVVLSGTGSDGSRGIKAIKEAGGLVFVQSPESAIFTGMPLAAKNSTNVDFVLAPKDIAVEIGNYLTHPLIGQRESALKVELENREHLMTEMFALLNRVHNIDFTYYRPSTIAHRLERRMGMNQIHKFEDYISLLKENEAELAKLCTDLLIGVTSFFRDSEAFYFLQKNVIEKLVLKSESNEEIRVWDVACSSGEEAYSLAIMFAETLERFNMDTAIKIFATDVDPQAIAEASVGTYNEEALQEINPEWRQKYFVKNKNRYTIKPSIRNMVLFAVHDVTKDPAFSSLNLVLCRNVLIYFQNDAQKRILSSLHYALNRNGYLFLGPSESLGDLNSNFHTISEPYKIFENLSESRTLSNKLDTNLKNAYTRFPPVSSVVKNHRALQNSKEYSRICEFLVREYFPVTIILNEEYKIDFIYGDASSYLIKPSSGKISTHILDLIAPELSVPLNSALVKVENEQVRVTYTDIKFKQNDEQVKITLETLPYIREERVSNIIVIIFIQPDSSEDTIKSGNIVAQEMNSAATKAIIYDEKVEPYLRIKQLEEELAFKHGHLQSTIQELESTNEEMQSSNEELLLSNEELQSTNEEIQSMNEELYTLNSEYQQKIIELTEINNDIQNLMKSTEIGMIFLDDNYNIRRFTPNTTKFVALVESDIGRSFFHFSNRLNNGSETVENIIRNVCDFGQVVERKIEVSDDSNKALLLRILPYTNQTQETNGVVITITDITNVSETEKKLEQAIEILGESIKDQLVTDQKRNYEVAILDDEVIDCKNIQRLLGKSQYENYHVDIYTDYKELAEALKKKKYNVLFIDYYLGAINAIDLLQQEQNVFTHTPIILMSGETTIQNKSEEFTQFSVYDIVPKNDLSTPLLERTIRFSIRMHEVREFTKRIEKS